MKTSQFLGSVSRQAIVLPEFRLRKTDVFPEPGKRGYITVQEGPMAGHYELLGTIPVGPDGVGAAISAGLISGLVRRIGSAFGAGGAR